MLYFTAENMASTHNVLHIASIDVARLMAIFTIMYGHMSIWGTGDSICNWLHSLLERGMCNPSAIFFIFSGYFAAMSDSWGKAVKNAAWCLATYVLWILLAIAFDYLTNKEFAQQIPVFENWIKWFGLHASFLVTTDWATTPIIGSYWYLRDLIVLLLLAPALKKIATPALCILIPLSLMAPAWFEEHINIIHSPFALSMFLVGCFVRNLSVDRQQSVLGFASPVLVGTFWLGSLVFFLNEVLHFANFPAKPSVPLLSAIVSMAIMYQTAVLVARRFPRLGVWSSKVAPAIYLAYVTHDLFRMAVEPYWSGTHVMALIPIADFALCWGIYYLLGKTSPFMLHLVAYAKPPKKD